jgi:hypothetical protein
VGTRRTSQTCLLLLFLSPTVHKPFLSAPTAPAGELTVLVAIKAEFEDGWQTSRTRSRRTAKFRGYKALLHLLLYHRCQTPNVPLQDFAALRTRFDLVVRAQERQTSIVHAFRFQETLLAFSSPLEMDPQTPSRRLKPPRPYPPMHLEAKGSRGPETIQEMTGVIYVPFRALVSFRFPFFEVLTSPFPAPLLPSLSAHLLFPLIPTSFLSSVDIGPSKPRLRWVSSPRLPSTIRSWPEPRRTSLSSSSSA